MKIAIDSFYPTLYKLGIEKRSATMTTAREAISKLRRKARIEMWYDKRNDGPISYTNKVN